MKRLVGLFVLSLLFSSYALTSPLQVRGMVHYRNGFLVLTRDSSSNTTQLWFYEPGKGFKLLNATFPNLTFVHSTGERVLLYRNISDIYSNPDVQFYVYDGTLHFVGGFNGVTDCGDELAVYWNGKFYLIFEPWDACQMTGYNWYALLNSTIYPLLDDDRGRSTICAGLKCYVGNLQRIPNGYLVGYTNFYTETTSLRAVVLTSSGIRMRSITFGNLSVEWGGSCFNGTHFGVLADNRLSVVFYNETVYRFYLGAINITGDYALIPLDSIPEGKNISLSLLGSYNGKWTIQKYQYWSSWNSSTGWITEKKTLGYLIVSPDGSVEVNNSLNMRPVCNQNWPLVIFEGRSPVYNTPLLNGLEFTINGSILTYNGKTFELPFNPKIGNCGNGCLFSDGEELAYFDGNSVQIVRFPREPIIEPKFLLVLGLVFTALLIELIVKLEEKGPKT